MNYEYLVTSHHVQSVFEEYLNQNAGRGWEPYLFSYAGPQVEKLGGFACIMRRQIGVISR